MAESQGSTRTVAHVFANYRTLVERGGKVRTIARSGKRGQQITLAPDEEARLDELGALVPQDEEGNDLFDPFRAVADLQDRVLSQATTRAEGLLPAAEAQASIPPPASGAVTPLAGTGDDVTLDVAEAGPAQIADHITTSKLKASDTVALAGEDPGLAARVLEAERLAHGSDARSTVEGPLQKIIDG